jgi:hypothetical protein
MNDSEEAKLAALAFTWGQAYAEAERCEGTVRALERKVLEARENEKAAWAKTVKAREAYQTAERETRIF